MEVGTQIVMVVMVRKVAIPCIIAMVATVHAVEVQHTIVTVVIVPVVEVQHTIVMALIALEVAILNITVMVLIVLKLGIPFFIVMVAIQQLINKFRQTRTIFILIKKYMQATDLHRWLVIKLLSPPNNSSRNS
ncbi:MAG: hypothetical protein OA34_04980 [Sulfurospirillum sp. MES]|nr:MAG: hypothetical protein OA34_04980 [Sulfurospirillum sp. MES]